MPRHAGLMIAVLLGALAVTGCEPGPAPDKPKEAPKPIGSTDLRDAIQRPLDRARAVEGQVEDAKQKADKALEDQGG